MTRSAGRGAQAGFQSHAAAMVSPPTGALGIVSNPAAGKNLRGRLFEHVRRIAHEAAVVAYSEADGRDELIAAGRDLVRAGIRIAVVNGGDGTLQAVVTGMMDAAEGGSMPAVLPMRAGTTNMIAADVDPRGVSLAELRELARGGAGGAGLREVQRHVMQVSGGGLPRPLCSFFFGAGAIYDGIQFCRDRIHTLGLRGEIGPGVALAIFLGKLMLGQRRSVLPPLRAEALLDSAVTESGQYFGLLITTLHRLFLGLRPFWGPEPGALRFSAADYHPKHLLRAAPSIMRGRPNRFVTRENGYVSHNASSVELRMDGGFTLDGELWAPCPADPVRVRDAGVVRFLASASARGSR